MKERMEARLQELRRELEQGEKMLTELRNRELELQQTMLRISGAIQVLEELSGEVGSGASPAGAAIADAAAD